MPENFLTPACDECGSPVPNHNRGCSRWTCPQCARFKEKLRNWEEGWNITYEDIRRVQESKPPNEETLRMALVAVSVVAGANTPHTAEHVRLPKDHPYWTVAHDDVCAAVDREMALRADLAAALAQLADEKQKVANLEEYMLKGVAFRDELQAQLAEKEGQVAELQRRGSE